MSAMFGDVCFDVPRASSIDGGDRWREGIRPSDRERREVRAGPRSGQRWTLEAEAVAGPSCERRLRADENPKGSDGIGDEAKGKKSVVVFSDEIGEVVEPNTLTSTFTRGELTHLAFVWIFSRAPRGRYRHTAPSQRSLRKGRPWG